MFSNRKVEKFDDRAPEFRQDLADESARAADPRQDPHAAVRRRQADSQDEERSTCATASSKPCCYRFSIDPTMIAFGEENRDWGGAFAVYRGLTEALPYHRLFNSPISEAAIVGAAVGYALEGGRVVAELMYADFMGRAGDEIFNQLSKWQAMSAGQLTMPVVLRISVGAEVRRAAFAGLDRAGRITSPA